MGVGTSKPAGAGSYTPLPLVGPLKSWGARDYEWAVRHQVRGQIAKACGVWTVLCNRTPGCRMLPLPLIAASSVRRRA